MALSKEEILDAISEMSVIDIVELIEAMEEKFGVSAAAPVAAAAPAASPNRVRARRRRRLRARREQGDAAPVAIDGATSATSLLNAADQDCKLRVACPSAGGGAR